MKKAQAIGMLSAALAFAFASSGQAAVVLVGNSNPGRQGADEIDVSETWTANNVYRLQDQIWVRDGATLTIEAGTRIESTANLGGSLAVCRDSQIFIQGTKEAPVVFTSTNDNGTYRQAVNEWGNLTIMGNGLISASHFAGVPIDPDGLGVLPNNPKIPDGTSQKQMEGMTAVAGFEYEARYGGDDDEDDSGSISYVSLRYGGKVIGLGNELNGLSLGGIGSETDISHVEIMNNVDDGIEIWGGKVNIKNAVIWNVGDDSFDVDQGWRGKAQNILVVQGYSINGTQGSGVGDNAFETDGAEDCDAQPVTSAVIYNATVIGALGGGSSSDHGTAWRDNARVQYRNCIFMDLGDNLINNDGNDGDGARGYGCEINPPSGTFSMDWATTWATAAGTHPTWNAAPGTLPGDFNHPDTLYTAQTTGFLSEMTDSVFYNNTNSAYGESDARGVTVAGDDAPLKNNVVSAVTPVKKVTRGTPVLVPPANLVITPVALLNPLAVNDAVNAAATAPNDGFFMQQDYRGAFGPQSADNWIDCWTAADEFGLVESCPEDIVPPGGDGNVTISDVTAILTQFGLPCVDCPEDIAPECGGDNAVTIADINKVVTAFGPC